MTFLHAIVLAIVQGATEFIPISSSGHLVLVREWLHWSDEGGLYIDTLLHAASLLAVLIYFRQDWLKVLHGFFGETTEDSKNERKLAWLLIYATIPVILVGPFINAHMGFLRKGGTIGLIMIMTSAWYVLCEGVREDKPRPMNRSTAIVMGLAQVFALMPGASRAGLTISAGLLCGQRREDAARFSFFMAIPTILGAMILQAGDMLANPIPELSFAVLAVGFVVCFLVSIASIHFCMQLFKKHSLVGFGIYLAILGIVLVLIRFVH